MKFTAIDFETANYYRDSACAVALVRVEGKKIVKKISYLIRPASNWFCFTDIHGISWQDVKMKNLLENYGNQFVLFFVELIFLLHTMLVLIDQFLRLAVTDMALRYQINTFYAQSICQEEYGVSILLNFQMFAII